MLENVTDKFLVDALLVMLNDGISLQNVCVSSVFGKLSKNVPVKPVATFTLNFFTVSVQFANIIYVGSKITAGVWTVGVIFKYSAGFYMLIVYS